MHAESSFGDEMISDLTLVDHCCDVELFCRVDDLYGRRYSPDVWRLVRDRHEPWRYTGSPPTQWYDRVITGDCVCYMCSYVYFLPL